MNLTLCQYAPKWEDPQANHDDVEQRLHQTVASNQSNKTSSDQLIVLPEMFATGFSMDAQRIGQPIDGPTNQWLRRCAQQYHSYLVGGVAHYPNAHATNSPSAHQGDNSAVAYDPTGERIAHYRKMHLITPMDESDHYQPGAQPTCLTIGQWTVGLAICYDLRFPELFRYYRHLGVDLMIVLANWPTCRIDHWQALLTARAIENQCYIVGVNRCGQDPYYTYGGQSGVIDPTGQWLVQADDQPATLTCHIDHDTVTSTRQNFNVHADRHPTFIP